MKSLSLKTKMTLAVCLLTAILLSTLAFSAQLYFVQQIKALIADQQFSTVSALAEQIDDKLKSSHNELIAAASTIDREIVRDPAKLDRFFAGRPDTLAMFDNGLFLFSPEGTLLSQTSIDPQLLTRNFSHREYLAQTLASKRPQISEPFISAQFHRHPILMFTAPIFDRNGAVIAVLGGSLDLTKENFLRKIGAVKLGERGYLYLISRERFLIAHPDRERVVKQLVAAPGVNRLYDRAVQGFEGTGETTDSHGVCVISSFKRLKSTGWILVSNFPEPEAYAAVYRVQRYLSAALFLVFSFSMLIVWLSMKRLTEPLISFTSQIRNLTSGHSRQPRVTVTTGDEIGVLGEAFNGLLAELERQRSELKTQLEFSQTLIDSIPIPVFYKDRDGRYLGCNNAFEQVSGYGKHQLIGKTVFEVEPVEVSGLYHPTNPDLLQLHEAFTYETEARYADGNQRDVIFYKTAFPSADGGRGGVIGAMLDITDRKRAENELSAQKEFAESLVQNSVLPTFVLDDRHRVIIWNRACELLTGVKAEDVLGSDQLWRQVYPEKRPVLADLLIDGDLEGIDRHYGGYTQSTLSPDGVQVESWFVDRQGRGHHLMVNAAPIRDTRGNLVAVIETLDDFTERKLAQDAHEKTRRQLQLILDAAGEGIYGIDLAGKITFVNPAAAQMFGWDPGELLGQHHLLLHHPKGVPAPCALGGCPVHGALVGGRTRQVPDQLLWRKDGTSFPVEYICTPLREEGELVGAVVICKDTTARKAAEDQLLKLSQAVMQSPVPMIITDLVGRIEFVNPKFTEVSGYQAAEIIGASTRVLKAGKTRPEVYRSLWSTISTGRVWTGDLQNRAKNGDLFWVHSTISPIRNAAGAVTHYLAFLESMTERRQLEEQLRQAQKMEAIGQLAGGVAHDFNNILTVIMGFGQLLVHTLRPDDLNRSHMKQILDAADRATHLTSSLLAFSRKQVMLLQQVELNELTRNHIRFLSRIIGEDVTLRTELGHEPLAVLADAGQIEQVLMNLATNARDAMPGGGELVIRTDSVVLDGEFYRQHGFGAPGAYARIAISDNGCGMEAEILDKIFEPFFTTKAPGRGTGLGLSIVYGIVKQHGGHITIDSRCGAGTTFHIFIPLVAAGSACQADMTDIPVPRGGGETILVVEDDPMVRSLVNSVLQNYGYQVMLADNGEHAVELFEANWQNIDLALLDVIMPRMNGKQVCEALRQRSPHLKVLFLTGYTADLIHDKGILMEGIDLMSKPAQPAELAKKVREMLDAR